MGKYFYNSYFGNRTSDLMIVMTYTFVDSVDGLYTVMSLNPKPLRNGFGFKLITVYKHIDIINKSVRLN